jgi:hypothetical protein
MVAIDFVNKKFRAELAAYQKQQPGVLELSAGIQLKPGFWPLSCGAIFVSIPCTLEHSSHTADAWAFGYILGA